MVCGLDYDKKEQKDFIFNLQFEGFSNHGNLNIGDKLCGYIDAHNNDKPDKQDELDQKIADSGKLKVINEIDPIRNLLDIELFEKFLSVYDHTYMDRSRPKGPDYLVIDHFLDFSLLDYSDLIKAREEAEFLTEKECNEAS